MPLPIGFDPQCEGGTDLGVGNGTTVGCANAPRLYAGRPTPKWNGSFSATLPRSGDPGLAIVTDAGAVASAVAAALSGLSPRLSTAAPPAPVITARTT